MTAPDARDELREALARAFADGVAMRRQMEPLTDRQWAVARAAWEHDIAPLLPVVTAWAEKQARARAVEELTMAADAAEHCVENPEMPWAQGVEFVVAELRDRADALESGGSR